VRHVAHTLVDHARMLLSRRAPGDEQQARELLATAAPLAEIMGMAGLIADIGVLQRDL
jgi:hypothetical protein